MPLATHVATRVYCVLPTIVYTYYYVLVDLNLVLNLVVQLYRYM